MSTAWDAFFEFWNGNVTTLLELQKRFKKDNPQPRRPDWELLSWLYRQTPRAEVCLSGHDAVYVIPIDASTLLRLSPLEPRGSDERVTREGAFILQQNKIKCLLSGVDVSYDASPTEERRRESPLHFEVKNAAGDRSLEDTFVPCSFLLLVPLRPRADGSSAPQYPDRDLAFAPLDAYLARARFDFPLGAVHFPPLFATIAFVDGLLSRDSGVGWRLRVKVALALDSVAEEKQIVMRAYRGSYEMLRADAKTPGHVSEFPFLKAHASPTDRVRQEFILAAVSSVPLDAHSPSNAEKTIRAHAVVAKAIVSRDLPQACVFGGHSLQVWRHLHDALYSKYDLDTLYKMERDVSAALMADAASDFPVKDTTAFSKTVASPTECVAAYTTLYTNFETLLTNAKRWLYLKTDENNKWTKMKAEKKYTAVAKFLIERSVGLWGTCTFTNDHYKHGTWWQDVVDYACEKLTGGFTKANTADVGILPVHLTSLERLFACAFSIDSTAHESRSEKWKRLDDFVLKKTVKPAECLGYSNLQQSHLLAKYGRVYAEVLRAADMADADAGNYAPAITSYLFEHLPAWVGDKKSTSPDLASGTDPDLVRELLKAKEAAPKSGGVAAKHENGCKIPTLRQGFFAERTGANATVASALYASKDGYALDNLDGFDYKTLLLAARCAAYLCSNPATFALGDKFENVTDPAIARHMLPRHFTTISELAAQKGYGSVANLVICPDADNALHVHAFCTRGKVLSAPLAVHFQASYNFGRYFFYEGDYKSATSVSPNAIALPAEQDYSSSDRGKLEAAKKHAATMKTYFDRERAWLDKCVARRLRRPTDRSSADDAVAAGEPYFNVTDSFVHESCFPPVLKASKTDDALRSKIGVQNDFSPRDGRKDTPRMTLYNAWVEAGGGRDASRLREDERHAHARLLSGRAIDPLERLELFRRQVVYDPRFRLLVKCYEKPGSSGTRDDVRLARSAYTHLYAIAFENHPLDLGCVRVSPEDGASFRSRLLAFLDENPERRPSATGLVAAAMREFASGAVKGTLVMRCPSQFMRDDADGFTSVAVPATAKEMCFAFAEASASLYGTWPPALIEAADEFALYGALGPPFESRDESSRALTSLFRYASPPAPV